MDSWKQAYSLASLELKASKKQYFLLLLLYTAAGIVLLTLFDSYLEDNFAAFDLLFLILYILFPVWMKPKEFQMQKLEGKLWTVPALIMHQQLPIPKNVFIKSRMIIHGVYSFPYQLILLISLYALSENFRDMVTPVSYAAFLIIWLSFSIYIGFMMAASDGGGSFDSKEVFFSAVWLVGGAAILYVIVRLFMDSGLVYWTVTAAVEWPVLSAAVSLIAAVLGWNYWQRDMKKMIEKTDYL